jgi:hypothetical protein
MMGLLNKKGQNTLEYAVLIAVVVGGLLAIQTYLGRAIKGRARSSIDNIGSQYSAGDMTAEYNITVKSQTATEKFGTTLIGGQGHSQTSTTGGESTRETIAGGEETTVTALNEEVLFPE